MTHQVQQYGACIVPGQNHCPVLPYMVTGSAPGALHPAQGLCLGQQQLPVGQQDPVAPVRVLLVAWQATGEKGPQGSHVSCVHTLPCCCVSCTVSSWTVSDSLWQKSGYMPLGTYVS